jgi:hypothetical protein
MTPPIHGLGPYQAAMLEARRLGLVLGEAQRQRLLLLLDDYAAAIAKSVGAGTVTPHAAGIAKTINGLLKELGTDLANSTADGVRMTTRSMAAMHARATAALFEANGVAGTGALFIGVNTAAAQAVLARPVLSATFKNIIASSSASADRIIQQAIIEGAPASHLAQRLRLHITGSEGLPSDMLLDRRKITYAGLKAAGIDPTPENLAGLRKHAGSVANRAELIARTEISNAAHEASARAAEDSPVVGSVQWYLSNRHPEQDECDAYAETDFYGLGAGVYDPRKVPPKPHPRCLCGLRQNIRPVAEWKKPKPPAPRLTADPKTVAEKYEFPPSRTRNLENGVRVAEGRNDLLKRAQAAAGKAAEAEALAATTAAAGKAMQGAEAAMAAIVKAKTPTPIKAGIQQAHAAKAAAEAAQAKAAAELAENAADLGQKKLDKVLAANAKSSAKAAAKKKAAKLDEAAAKVLDDLAKLDANAAKALKENGTYNVAGKIALKVENGATLKAATKATLDEALKLGKHLADEAAINTIADSANFVAQGASKVTNVATLQKNLEYIEKNLPKADNFATAKNTLLTAKATIQAQLDALEAAAKAAAAAAQAAASAQVKVWTDLADVLYKKATDPSKAGGAMKWKKTNLAAGIKDIEELLDDIGTVGGPPFQKSSPAGQLLEAHLKAQLADLASKTEEMSKVYAAHAAKYKKGVSSKAGLSPAQAQAAVQAEQAAQAAQSAVTQAGKAAAKDAAEAAAKAPAKHRVWTEQEILHEFVSGPGGSNPGGVHRGSDGILRYVKFYDDEAQAQGERLANEVYRRLGHNAPESIVVRMKDGRFLHAAEMVEMKGTVGNVGLTKKLADNILDGFAADILTANWDAVGLSLDNVVVLKNGKIARIDQGGSFLMRAQKARRKDIPLLKQITEWDNFNNHVNPSYASVFSKAGVAGGNGLGQRIIDQIDEIVALQKKAGGWRAFVDDALPGYTGADRTAMVDMLEARTQLLLAKKAEVKAAMDAAKKQAAEMAKLQKELAAKMKAGGSKLRPDDIRAITIVETELRTELSAAELQAVANGLAGNKSGAADPNVWNARDKIAAIRDRSLARRAQEMGLTPVQARAAVRKYDHYFAQWQGSASSEGAGVIKYLGMLDEGGEIYHHKRFIDKDQAERLQVIAAAKSMLRGHGLDEALALELFRADRNLQQAMGNSIGRATVKLWRRVNDEHFNGHGIPKPRKGATGYGQQNAVSGWTFVKGSYPGTVEFEVEIPFRDVVSGWWTRGNGISHGGEHEMWIVSGDSLKWTVSWTGRYGSSH